jgi:hypothetical protein
MDLMKWLSSLDELLYEVMSWLVFFPVTLWRTLTRPLGMMDYADQQLTLPEGEQYSAALSPPLFLALTLLIAHGLSAALGEADELVVNHHGLAGLINDETSALVLRLIVFAAFPLIASVNFVRRRGLAVDRGSLRLPFYAQCYPAGVFALCVSLGAALIGVAAPATRLGGWLLIGASIVYYFVIETRWFAAKLAIGRPHAAGIAALGMLEGLILLLLVGFLFSR